ncbi:uncharacterized protein LOC119603514 [Lucilia sericata]|uniref:uncharacterized protein LOC119603514 n=1 Tax=Lucilia sericata TaxID=13632 RepID=UPI0018A7FB69|nr:uncharacterized protein LOC119603514 [Lucilia sericata]
MFFSFRNGLASKNLLKFHKVQHLQNITRICGRDVYTTTKCDNLVAADVLPIPNNIDVAETTRFSPHRSREISSTVILSQNYQGISSPKIDITTDNSFSNAVLDKQDPHVQSYDCFGAISLNSAMQSNVPSPFGGMHKFTHLNMPGGQWSQDCKFMSQNLQSSHYTTLRKNARSNWSTYDKDATTQKDSTLAWNLQSKRRYCNKANKPDEMPQAQSKKDQLKKAFKDYGSTIIIFHVAISLVSLGGFYLLVSSGIDLIAILEHLEFAPTALKNSVALGASNFVIAYAVHKVFAPVRISITLGATPFIVRYLRSKGLLKSKNK